MDDKKIIFVLIVIMIVFALLFIGIILFMIQFRRSRLMHMEELLKTKLEIQDQTLTHIGRELHDNLGQLLTVSKIHVNSLVKQHPDNQKLDALDKVLDKTVVELRALSKSLNNSRIKEFGLYRELSNEVERIQKMQLLEIILHIDGEIQELPNDKAIILYRVIQEFLSNSLKHAGASRIDILFHYTYKQLKIILHDNGKGFDLDSADQGSGVSNIRNRIQLLNATETKFSSIPGSGTQLNITLQL